MEHRIQDDLAEVEIDQKPVCAWLDDYISAGMGKIDQTLAKYAAFHAYLLSQGLAP